MKAQGGITNKSNMRGTNNKKNKQVESRCSMEQKRRWPWKRMGLGILAVAGLVVGTTLMCATATAGTPIVVAAGAAALAVGVYCILEVTVDPGFH